MNTHPLRPKAALRVSLGSAGNQAEIYTERHQGERGCKDS